MALPVWTGSFPKEKWVLRLWCVCDDVARCGLADIVAFCGGCSRDCCHYAMGDMSALIPKARKRSTSCHLLLYVPYIFMLCRLGPQHRAAHFLGMRALLCGTQLPLAAFVGLLPFFM